MSDILSRDGRTRHQRLRPLCHAGGRLGPNRAHAAWNTARSGAVGGHGPVLRGTRPGPHSGADPLRPVRATAPCTVWPKTLHKGDKIRAEPDTRVTPVCTVPGLRTSYGPRAGGAEGAVPGLGVGRWADRGGQRETRERWGASPKPVCLSWGTRTCVWGGAGTEATLPPAHSF